MKNIPNGVLLMSAAGLTLAGVAVAGNLYLQHSSTDPRAQSRLSTMRELASRVGDTHVSLTPLAVPAGPEVPKPLIKKPVKVAQVDTAKKPDPTPVKPPVPGPDSGPRVKPDLVKNIALMGVTHEGGADQVWLVDTNEGRRETAATGESAFGFRVKTISDDSVVLSRNGDDYTVRMGDKEIPSQTASADGGTLSGTDDAGGLGGGQGGPGGRGGRGGFGGRGGLGGFGGRNGFNRGGFGGGNFGGGGMGANNSGFTPTQFNRQNFGGFNRGGFGGGFGGGGGFNRGGFAGGGFNRGQGGGATSQFASGASVTTSNPQTARRSGGRLVGGSTAMPKPSAIANPQTTRRTGGTSGTAFGQANGTVAGMQQNSTNGSRFGGFGAGTGFSRGN